MGRIIKTDKAMKIMCTLALFEKLVALGWFESKENEGYVPTEKGYDKLLSLTANKRVAKILNDSNINPIEERFDILTIKVIFAKLIVLGWADNLTTFSFKGINRLLRLIPRLPTQASYRIARQLHHQGVSEKEFKKRSNH